MAIIEFINDRMDLYHLCQTSRLLRLIAEPKLLELHFGQSKQAKEMDTRSIILHPRFELLVNTVFLRLRPRYPKICTDRVGPPCNCEELDKDLGRALNGLLHLKTLRLQCHLCSRVGPYEKHKYLATLQTKVLQEVQFHCSCTIMDEKKLMEYLGAPCMTPVTTLGWGIYGPITPNQYLKTSLTNPNILPNLRTLFYVRNSLSYTLLRCRPIQKLAVPHHEGDGILESELTKSRGVITHICTQGSHNPTTLIRTIAANPIPFWNLQHLGTFRLGTCTLLVRTVLDLLVKLTVL
jgi:hypothetical protein